MTSPADSNPRLSDPDHIAQSIVALKYGGNAMTDEGLKQAFVAEVGKLRDRNIQPVVIHGGGPVIQDTLDQAGIESRFIDGHRKTPRDAMRYVEMALKGNVNGDLVRLFNHSNLPAVGLSGKDSGMTRVFKRRHEREQNGKKEVVDLGFVGDVDMVDPTLLHLLMDNGYIPVVAPIGLGEDGQDYNVNADMFAGHIAGAVGADLFLVLTNVDGLLIDVNDPSSKISRLRTSDIDRHTGDTIKGGMIPKIEACRIAIENGVGFCRIINGTKPETISSALDPDASVGTEIYA